jgi:uncharacterized RDD family membrane protein YckC
LKRDHVVIETPEKVRVTYQIASPLSRAAAFVLDTILFLVLLGLIFLLLYGVFTVLNLGEVFDANLLGGIVYFVIFVVVFIFRWFYYIFFEMMFNGKTFGKMVVRLRVIHYKGKYLDFSAVVLRNFMRIIDQDASFFFGATICMMANRDYRRIGDLAASTIVIREEKLSTRLPDFSITGLESTSAADHIMARLSEEDLYIIRRFLNSRSTFTPEKSNEMAHTLAQVIRQKLGDDTPVGNPVDYLTSVYKKHEYEH